MDAKDERDSPGTLKASPDEPFARHESLRILHDGRASRASCMHRLLQQHVLPRVLATCPAESMPRMQRDGQMVCQVDTISW